MQLSEADRAVGANIRAMRQSLGVSMTELAADLGISYQQVQKYETGRNRTSAGALCAIGEALGVRAAKFLPPEHR